MGLEFRIDYRKAFEYEFDVSRQQTAVTTYHRMEVITDFLCFIFYFKFFILIVTSHYFSSNCYLRAKKKFVIFCSYYIISFNLLM